MNEIRTISVLIFFLSAGHADVSSRPPGSSLTQVRTERHDCCRPLTDPWSSFLLSFFLQASIEHQHFGHVQLSPSLPSAALSVGHLAAKEEVHDGLQQQRQVPTVPPLKAYLVDCLFST